jgi:hypothetical protein
MTPEGRVKAAVKKYLSAKGVWHFSPVSNGMGVHGIPDVICCWNGQFLGVECKAPGKRGNVSELQKMQIEAIRAANGIVLIVDSVEPLKELLDA